MKKGLISLLIVSAALLSLLLGCSNDVAPAGQTFEVTRGDLDIVVSSDGSLTMPNEFDLRFGTQGQVSEILVEEGDSVKQGSLLAMLDSTSQRNAIRTALFSIQAARNEISYGCGVDHLPYTYPDLSATRLSDEAEKDMDAAINYFKQENYKEAGYKLVMAYFDIEVCEDLIKFKPDAAVLAGAKINSTYSPDLTAGSSREKSFNDEMVVDYLERYRQKLMNIAGYMKVGDYERAAPEFDAAQREMVIVKQMAKSTISINSRLFFEFADTPTSVDFLQSSLRYLQELEDYLAQDDASALEAAKKLYLAKLNLLVGRDALENQTLIFESGGAINWKTLQQYNLSLQGAEIALYQAKQNIMNTAIIAPVDGTVVSVDLKKSSVLSAQDYSAKTAVKLVDTKSIKFTGLVDEIDIMKVKPGQKAEVTVDAVPGRTFTGTVKFISPYGTEEGNVVKFALTIELDPYDVELRGGLSATADIGVYSAENVLLVPVSMLITTPAGSFVTVMNESTGQPEPRKVTLGRGNFQYFEVLSGLEEGDKILPPSLSPLGNMGIPSQGMPPPGM
jgi:HlyD family secretion protein